MGQGPQEGELVARLRQGQGGAFDAVYVLYREPVWRFLVRLAGRRDVAEDLFQETWLAAARSAHRLREDSQLLPWLYTIARNKHRNAIRFRLLERKRADEIVAHAFPATGDAEADADARRRAARVARALARLPEAHREILLLFFEEGLTTEGVATILGLGTDAVRKRLSRARAELARVLEMSERGEPNA